MVPEKVGLKGVTREGLDYEFTFVLELDLKHQATATKDRTQLFMDKPSFMITPGAGKIIRTTMLNDWISFVMLLSASSTLSCAGFQVVPSHFSTCPLVAVCWAIFRGVTVVPLPVKVASVFTTSVCRSRRDI
jgi:hypothetical protein